jgi:nucleoside-diphosphate-sugar epimerase
MKSDGKPWRPLVHIEDIALAFKCVAEAPRDLVHGEAFNVGRTSENYRVREVAEMVAKVVPNVEVTFASDASPDARNYRVNCDKIARTLPAYQPTWTVEAGIRQLYEAYKQAGLTKEEFFSPRYMRLAHVKNLMSGNIVDGSLQHLKAAA